MTAPVLTSVRPDGASAPTRAARSARAAASPARPNQLLHVREWTDPVLARFGHDPRSAYAERFWLSVLGPSSLCLIRFLSLQFRHEPDGYDIETYEVARSIGVSHRGGAHSAFTRTMDRLSQFQFVRLVDESTLLVRLHLPALTKRQTMRLPERLRAEHARFLSTGAPTAHLDRVGPIDVARRRARTLALSMLELGEDLEAAERQLHRWKFHPAIAFDAVRWAKEQLTH